VCCVKNARNALESPSMTYLPPLCLVSSSHQIFATQEWSSAMTEDLARPRAPIQSSSLQVATETPAAHIGTYAGAFFVLALLACADEPNLDNDWR
jgi:hypothetical protein